MRKVRGGSREGAPAGRGDALPLRLPSWRRIQRRLRLVTSHLLHVAVAARCCVKGIEAGLRAGEEGGFTVLTRDQYGNPCTSGGASVEVRVDQHAEGISVMPFEDLDDGT